jgi:hypothetical protein
MAIQEHYKVDGSDTIFTDVTSAISYAQRISDESGADIDYRIQRCIKYTTSTHFTCTTVGNVNMYKLRQIGVKAKENAIKNKTCFDCGR